MTKDELKKVTDLLLETALSHKGKLNQEEALQNIALAQMHILQIVQSLQERLENYTQQ